jgi:hypothetical protein
MLGWMLSAPSGYAQPMAEEHQQTLQVRLRPQGSDPAPASGTTIELADESIRQPDPHIDQNQKEREEKVEQEVDKGTPTFNTKFGIPLQEPGFKPSRAIRCDAIRHLKHHQPIEGLIRILDQKFCCQSKKTLNSGSATISQETGKRCERNYTSQELIFMDAGDLIT